MEWLLGGAAVWLLFNALGARGKTGNGCPPGYAPQQTANGVQCVPTGTSTQQGGPSTQQVIQDVVGGAGVLATGGGIAAGFIPHGAATAATGSSGAAASGGGGSSASGGASTGGTASTGTSTTAESADVVDAFAATVDTSIAGAVAASAFMVAAALAFVALGMALNSEAAQETAAYLREVARSAFNRYTRRIYGGENAMFDSFLSAVIPQVNTPTTTQSGVAINPPFLNMNPGSTKQSAKIQAASPTGVSWMTGAAPAPMPSPSTPYGFTRCDVTNDLPSGCASSDPIVAQYAQLVDGFFVNSVDPRLPAKLLMQTRAFYRWMQWTINAQMNSCLANYYPYKDAYRGKGEDSSLYWVTPANFDNYASQFFANLPAVMQPPMPVPWNDYPSLLSQATGYVALYNKANPTRQVNFNAFVAGLRFIGTANAAWEASYIGMGDNARQWTSGWPGDQQFTGIMLDALGLTAAGWTYSTWLAPNVGPNPIFLAYDPASGFLYDFVNAHNNPTQGVMYQFPPGGSVIKSTMVLPLNTDNVFNLPSVSALQKVSGGLGSFAGVRRPFAGFANIRARGLKGLGRFAAVSPGWRHRG